LNGVYTIPGLPEGNLYVSTSTTSIPYDSTNYVQQWYKNALSCDKADPVTTFKGAYIAGIDFQLFRDIDSDKDGMPDEWEVKYFGNTSRDGSGDFDGDGVTDLKEYQNGTDPVGNADSDNDGIPDKWEIKYFGDLSRDGLGDYDNDGVTDLDEYKNDCDPTKRDTDGDGYSDADEIACHSNPNLSSDTPGMHSPNKPSIQTATSNVALRYNVFSMNGTSDPDGDHLSSSEWQISIDSGSSGDKSIQGANNTILDRMLSLGNGVITKESNLLTLSMSESVLLPNTTYVIRTRIQDSTGLWSSWSDTVSFTTVATDPDDADDNGVDDSYQITASTDVNNNGVTDSNEDILVLSDAQGGKTIGVTTDKGTLGSMASLSVSDIFGTNQPSNPVPYGMFSFRIDGLSVGATAQVAFYFPEDIPSNTKWYKFNSADGTLIDDTADVVISGNKVVLSITDGGAGDADGVANGVIIDPSGPSFAQANSDNGSGNSSTGSGGGGGGCFIATAAFGSMLEPHVVTLREFRDKVLLNLKIGKAFVSYYYKHSPPIAHYIAKHDAIRMLVRWGLLPVVLVIQAILWLGHDAMTIFFGLLFVLMGGSLLVASMSRRNRSL